MSYVVVFQGLAAFELAFALVWRDPLLAASVSARFHRHATAVWRRPFAKRQMRVSLFAMLLILLEVRMKGIVQQAWDPRRGPVTTEASLEKLRLQGSCYRKVCIVARLTKYVDVLQCADCRLSDTFVFVSMSSWRRAVVGIKVDVGFSKTRRVDVRRDANAKS